MANHLVDRCADGLGETVIIERGGYGVLHIDNIVVADFVQLGSAHAGADVFANHFQYVGGKSACHAHSGDFFGRFNAYIHG